MWQMLAHFWQMFVFSKNLKLLGNFVFSEMKCVNFALGVKQDLDYMLCISLLWVNELIQDH